MKTKIHKTNAREMSLSMINETVAVLDKGGVVVFPTDTVYGIGASVLQPAAISRIYRLKGRSYKKPLPLLVAGFQQVQPLVESIPSNVRRMLKKFWPGPLTVVFKTSVLGQMSTGGKKTVAVRIPDHEVALAILKKINKPLAVTSANPSGRDPAVTGFQAVHIFKNRVPVIINGGACPQAQASTVLDITAFPWTIRRQGVIKEKDLIKYMI